MGRLRGWLRRLERESRGETISISQEDGITFIIGRMEAHIQCFTFLYESMQADCDAAPRPSPPPVLMAIANAKDRSRALEKVLDGYSNLPVDPEALIEEGAFVPVSLVAGYTYEEVMEQGGIPDLSDQALAERGEEE